MSGPYHAAMEIALDEARAALEHGDIPIGAVLLDAEGEILARRHNERELTNDPSAHAEVLVLRDGAADSGSWRLDGTTLVVTIEPCLMCAGTALWARVERIVFGAADPKAGACGSLYNVAVDPRLHHEIALVDGVRAGEAADLVSQFFASRR